VYLLLWCSPRLRSRSSAFCHVHYPSQYSHLFPFTESPPFWRWHPTVFLIVPTQLQFMHYPPSECPSANLFLDDCHGSVLTNLSHHRLPSGPITDSTALWLDRFFWASRFLANVNSRSRSLFAVARPSVCRLSVCLSSVTLVRPTQAVQIFGNISTALSTLAIHSHPHKTLRRSSQGNPSAGEVKHRRVAKYSDFGPIDGYISETVQDGR